MALNPGCRIGNASTNSSAALDRTSEFLAWNGERSFRIQRADSQRRQHRIPQAMLLVSQHRQIPIYVLKITVTFKLIELVRASLNETKLPAPCRQRRFPTYVHCAMKNQWPSCPAPRAESPALKGPACSSDPPHAVPRHRRRPSGPGGLSPALRTPPLLAY